MRTRKGTSGFKLALRTSVVSGMTLISRILGLVRDIVFARYFGASMVMDAFLVAQRIPNMLRRRSTTTLRLVNSLTPSPVRSDWFCSS